MKKFLSTVLALAMALSLCVPAFAADTVLNGVDGLGEGAVVEVTGTTQTATVKVTVPSGGNVVLNPYGLDYTVEGAANPVQDQIISAEQYIVNESNMPIKVSTKVTGTIEGTGDFAAASAVSETDKKVFLNFEIGKTTAKGTAAASYEKVNLTKTQVSCTDIVMDKVGGTNPAIAFKFTGDAAKNPTNPWTTDDIIGASIAFTFALDNSGAGGGGGTTAASVSLDKSSLTLASGTDTLTATFNAGTSGLTVTKYDWTSSTTGAYTVTPGGSASDTTATVTYVADGTSTITVTATLSDSTTVTATCTVSNA